MPVLNSEIAEIFDHLADLLEIKGANPFRVRAYRNAANTIRGNGRSMTDMVDAGENLSELPNIGEDLAGKITEIVRTGQLQLLEEVSSKVPDAIVEATRIPGVGPKKAQVLFQQLSFRTIGDLRQAAEEGRIEKIAGFGAKTQAKILEELSHRDFGTRQWRIDEAEDFAGPLLDWVRKIEGVSKAEIAGSYRRRKETVGDLDILAAGAQGRKIIDQFTKYDEIVSIASKGATRSTVTLRVGLQVDLRVVGKESWGSALHYFTGSKVHGIACRRRAQKRGLKLNEYGLFDGTRRIAGATEDSLYKKIGLPWIDPVLREAQGEIEAAEVGALPALIARDDIRGDLHAHTKASDGKNTLREMAEAAKLKNYEYLAITDHSKSQRVAGGLSERELEDQIEEIARMNESVAGFRLLSSCEVDILEDGSLDFPDKLLSKLDLVVVSVHSGFNLSEAEQTERIIRAMDNPLVSIVGHPTGRLIGMRRPYPVNIERLVIAAKERGCCLELNANPQRLDLSDVQCRIARDAGVMIAISTDAHTCGSLDNIQYGVDQARRGWLSAKEVLNTRGWKEVAGLLTRH